jgi:hypothetical protein
MGWSNPAMTRRHADMIGPIRHETASRIDYLLWAWDSSSQQPAIVARRTSRGVE